MRNDLSDRRQAQGWSQEALADRLGVSRQTVISLEKGRFDPSLPLAFKLAALFHCAIEDIFHPDSSPQNEPPCRVGASASSGSNGVSP
ncbi:helix-turn-helix transcriptional regulator [Microbacterium sp.]|uniref:helix-turn-helix transcriptional regulator n=1 Tax=Microbacterium sp. TaxID=51671 RepID=UPI0039E4D13E